MKSKRKRKKKDSANNRCGRECWTNEVVRPDLCQLCHKNWQILERQNQLKKVTLRPRSVLELLGEW